MHPPLNSAIILFKLHDKIWGVIVMSYCFLSCNDIIFFINANNFQYLRHTVARILAFTSHFEKM